MSVLDYKLFTNNNFIISTILPFQFVQFFWTKTTQTELTNNWEFMKQFGIPIQHELVCYIC